MSDAAGLAVGLELLYGVLFDHGYHEHSGGDHERDHGHEYDGELPGEDEREDDAAASSHAQVDKVDELEVDSFSNHFDVSIIISKYN